MASTKGPGGYDQLVEELLPRVTRWEHAAFARNHHLDPYQCERLGVFEGKLVKRAQPDRGYSYGFDGDGRLLVAREGQFELFYVWKGDTVTRLQFDRSAIRWAAKQKWSPKDQAATKRRQGLARLTLADGRLVRVETQGKEPCVEEYEYDRKGRLARIRVSEPKHTEELEYDAAGQLVGIVWRHPSGQGSDQFRRAPKEDALPKLLPQLKKALVDAIPKTLARARLRDEAYCVVIHVNLEEGPYLLPPHLTVGLVKDRDALIARGERSELWHPEAMPLFDDERLRLRDRALLALCKRTHVAREDDTPILVMLRTVAAALQRRGLDDVLHASPELLVYALDVSAEDATKAAVRMAPQALVKKLRAQKLV